MNKKDLKKRIKELEEKAVKFHEDGNEEAAEVIEDELQERKDELVETEQAEAETNKVEVEAESSEELEVEAKEEEEVEKVATSIAQKIADTLSSAQKASVQAEKKAKALSGAGYSQQKVKMYRFRSPRKQEKNEWLTMEKEDMKQTSKWFIAMIEKDRSAMRKIYDQMSTKLEPLVEGTAADGGFLVPVLLANFITEVKEDVAVIRPRANYINMSGMKTDQLDITGIATKPRVSWNNENADKGTSSMTFRQVSLTPYKMAAIVTMSTELRDDAPFNVVQLVGTQLGMAVAREEDSVFMNGNGTGRPTGIDNYTLTAVNAAGALSFDDIISTFYTLPQPYRNDAYWIMNSRVMSVIRQFKDSQNDYILKPFGFITEPQMPSMLGRPVLENNNTNSDSIFFGDLRNYHIADKGGPKLSTSEEATVGGISLWQRNLIGIRIEERVDAELEPTQSFVEVTNTGVS